MILNIDNLILKKIEKNLIDDEFAVVKVKDLRSAVNLDRLDNTHLDRLTKFFSEKIGEDVKIAISSKKRGNFDVYLFLYKKFRWSNSNLYKESKIKDENNEHIRVLLNSFVSTTKSDC